MSDIPDHYTLDRTDLVKQMDERRVIEALQIGDEAALLDSDPTIHTLIVFASMTSCGNECYYVKSRLARKHYTPE